MTAVNTFDNDQAVSVISVHSNYLYYVEYLHNLNFYSIIILPITALCPLSEWAGNPEHRNDCQTYYGAVSTALWAYCWSFWWLRNTLGMLHKTPL